MSEQPLITTHRSRCRMPVYTIHRFSLDLQGLDAQGNNKRARIFCGRCLRHHHIRWEEMQQAIARGADSLQAIVARFAGTYCDHAVVGIARVDEDNLAERLMAEMEAMHPDIQVEDALLEEEGRVSMLIQTPAALYNQSALPDEWRQIVRNDIRASSNRMPCLFCGNEETTLDFLPFRLSCGHCDAVAEEIMGGGVRVLFDDLAEDLDESHAAELLVRFHDIFRIHQAPGWPRMAWVDLKGYREAMWGADAAEWGRAREGIRGPYPNTDVEPADKHTVPLYFLRSQTDAETRASIQKVTEPTTQQLRAWLDDGDNKGVLRMPTCAQCRYAMVIADKSGAPPEAVRRYCLSPRTDTGVHDALVALYGSEPAFLPEDEVPEAPGQASLNRLANRVLDHVVTALDDVTEQSAELEAWDTVREAFVGPVCAGFSADTKALTASGMKGKAPFRAPLLFGVENAARRATTYGADLLEGLLVETESLVFGALGYDPETGLASGPRNVDIETTAKFLAQFVPEALLLRENRGRCDSLNVFGYGRKDWNTVLDKALARRSPSKFGCGTRPS